ncbi:MOSC domain-containing protein [Herbidospora cretacea]|uniref:MOSC domain-containing protein n=1 Tax=Herbidospora cretacea TaxID=28444 RepID=UPI0004C38C54|nr:MOSC N-terminal beta barrel domain-containing protein [Herbidospora cretacea]
MSADTGSVVALRRYPVKSMLGEDVEAAAVTEQGVEGDRVAALLDVATGMVASAKHPRLWRDLLGFAARWDDGTTLIRLPDGRTVGADHAGDAVSRALGREVRLLTTRPEQATVVRPDPEAVMDAGVDADVPYIHLQIGQGTPGRNFVDYAPIHLVTTATLARAGAEMVRYRPNLVVDLPGATPYAENDWTGRELTVGPVVLRVLGPTPRCAVPTLAHGDLPRRTDAVRTLLRDNHVGGYPCLGAYAEVVRPGGVAVGDRVVR